MKYKSIVVSILGFLSVGIFASPEHFVSDGKIINELKTSEYLALVRPFLPENPIILEAGAHDGQDTVTMSNAWPLGVVYAFEAVAKFAENIKRNIESHHLHNVYFFPVALSPKSGEQTFYYSTAIGAASSLLKDAGMEQCKYGDVEIKVTGINLDEWAQQRKIDHIDFMWLDMEGSELSVLQSAPNILKTVKAIHTEVNFHEFRQGGAQYQEIYDFLTANGFTLYRIWGNPKWQGNALFIKRHLV